LWPDLGFEMDILLRREGYLCALQQRHKSVASRTIGPMLHVEVHRNAVEGGCGLGLPEKGPSLCAAATAPPEISPARSRAQHLPESA